MTNKPMLSVELRAVLSMILNALDRDAAEWKVVRGEMAQELRTLLDKPAKPAPVCVNDLERFEADDGVFVRLGDVIDMLGNEKAAQHQGEPVAWVIQWGSVIPVCKGHREVVLKDPGDLDAVITPLYAEQPAPVAVVMPEIRKPDGWQSLTSQDLGWNAALAEVARLNGVKP